MPYSAPLDGIRAVAILAVLIFHISPAALKGGFTGVDVFFVLSGFLITSIVLHDIRDGSFSMREFYLRRVQRLLPNIVVTVLAVLLLWTLFMPPSTAVQAGRHGLWTIFNLSNFYIWRNLGGYWGDAAEWAPLMHTWSLGVEEQFYLFLPGSLLLLARVQRNRVLAWLVAATVVSLGLWLYGSKTHPVATFYLLPTRVWELLIGAALAAHRTPLCNDASYRPPLGPKILEAMGWIGLGMILVGFFVIDEANGFPGLVALAPAVGTAFLLVSIADGKTRMARLLSAPVMVVTGKLSYSLYLWHWPLITLGKIQADLHGVPQLAGAAAGGLVGILLACAAYVGVEKPLRQRGPGRPRRFATIAVGFCIAALGSVLVVSQHAVPDPDHHFDTPSFHGLLYSAGRGGDPDRITRASRYSDVYFPPLPPRADDAWRTGGIIHLYGGGSPKVVVMGDSHALMYSRLIDDICREMGVSVAFLGVDQTPVFFTAAVNEIFPSHREAHEFDETRRKWLREWHPEAVLIIDRWDSLAGTSNSFDEKLRSFLSEVSPLASRILFVAQVPVAKWGEEFNLRELMIWRMRTERDLPRLDPDRNERVRKQAVAVAEAATADFHNLRVLRADLPFYREDGSIRWASGRSFFYADDDHLTDAGAEVVRRLFRSAIAEAHSASSTSSTSGPMMPP